MRIDLVGGNNSTPAAGFIVVNRRTQDERDATLARAATADSVSTVSFPVAAASAVRRARHAPVAASTCVLCNRGLSDAGAKLGSGCLRKLHDAIHAVSGPSLTDAEKTEHEGLLRTDPSKLLGRLDLFERNGRLDLEALKRLAMADAGDDEYDADGPGEYESDDDFLEEDDDEVDDEADGSDAAGSDDEEEAADDDDEDGDEDSEDIEYDDVSDDDETDGSDVDL